ncbi:MAG: OmpH family outer membrane protein [Bacteroidota bacterium]
MKKFMKISFLFIAFLSMTLTVQAQKYGYVDSENILNGMNEVKQMTPELESLQTQLQKKGQQMVEDLQTKSKNAQAKLERGEMSPKEQETMQAELQQDQSKILAFEQEMQQKMLDKREELLKPILDKVNGAIEQVAKENGYTMIFNGSRAAGILLFVDGSADITPQVKTKLGI